MANPNIVNVSAIYGTTTYFTPSGTTAVVLLPNAASSGKVFKINQIVAANVTGTISPGRRDVVPSPVPSFRSWQCVDGLRGQVDGHLSDGGDFHNRYVGSGFVVDV